ncbi:unnamed protein product [Paramecium primaurelia]|uniref:WD40-repeat-containing domain n=1 Tax=Paramecium primaurelia TaxID=5886 RepID=A0A8S1P3V4_PARPR|nr:unnamed protein product [Paramecium primaurelia]
MQMRCNQADHLNQQLIGVCIDSKCQQQRPYCNFCLASHGQHLNKLLELIDDWIRKRVLIIQNVLQKTCECKLALDSLLNKFINLYNIILVQLPKLGLSQIDNIIKGLSLIDLWEKTLLNQFQQSIEQIIQKVKEIFENQKKQTNADNLQILNPFNIKEQIFEQKLNLNPIKYNLKSFTFELINQNSIQQKEYCYAIEINKDNSIVVAGCGKQIKVFDLKQGKLNQSQLLSDHQQNVLTLNFMKKSNHFVSGSYDKLIIIWQMNQNNQWTYQHKLYGHSDSISTLILNNNEDVIISGSYNNDSSIKFWNKQNGWLCQQTIKDHTHNVYSLSLNEKQDKLICCSQDQQILVIEYSQNDQIWNVIQKIKVEQYGYRLSFINDNQFTFQPYNKECMHVYENNSNNQQFVKINQITVKSGSNSCANLFPQQYLKCKCLLVNKNGQNINLIRKKENGDFVTEQTIQIDHHYIFGQLSDDGEYLITWDQKSKEIQTRKCKEL